MELKFIPHSIEAITGKRVEAVIIDMMGIEGRKKSILATYQGRHHTIGDADLRAGSTDMLPLRSGGCRSTDSEAMNIVEIMILVILKRKARIVERGITRMEKHET